MNYSSVDAVYGKSFDLSNLFAMEQNWRDNSVFEMKKPRETSAFLYVDSGKLSYNISDGTKLFATEGTIIYLPKGSMYFTRFNYNTDNEKIRTLLCEFQAIDEKGSAFVLFDNISKFEIPDVKDRFYDMINSCKMPNHIPALMKSIAFGIISRVMMYAKNISLKSSSAFSSIRKGILYLESDPLQEKSIPEIAEMCNVSESGFRRLFKQYSGYSPNEYRINEKISRSKKLLLTESMTVEEISNTLGFSDSAYFCKLFKKKTGVTPMEYAKLV